MLHVTGIDLNPDSREEHLPGYTPNFPHIASLVQGARYFGGKASWHWHESVELFYVRKGAILYRTPALRARHAGGQRRHGQQQRVALHPNFKARS